ncbi:SpoIIE family protein phosphatase [Streptomyces sp. NPDC088785]|uniref:SpoIIE family protein phosphatase n=1 Tax=Streptomyces sp. NPDC088785 TaxID=3365897 RepID=UPI003821FB3F
MTHSASDGGPALVLVVDDNAITRYVLGTTLRRAGHEVLEAEDGTQALDLLQHGPRVPDAAIIDIQLPDMTGFEVCERVKADARTAGVPVLHISATAVSVTDRTQGLNRGADAYLTEPIAPDELIATLSATLRYTRARRRAETLAERLHQLHRATLSLYSAPDAQRLADAAAAGAAAVLTRPAAVRLTAPDGTPHTRGHPDVAPLDVHAFDRVAAALDGSGVHVMPYTSADDGRRYLLAAARTKKGRPATCIAVPAAAGHATPDAEEQDEEILAQVTHTAALALETLRTYSEEHNLALTLQRSFLPEELPRTPRARFAVRYLPASEHAEIGGDFYEALTTPAGVITAVGDVAGHSLEAAMVMGQIRHGLRAYALEGHPPQAILERLDTLLRTVARGVTLTLCIMLLEETTGVLHIANAGHLPPLLLGRDAEAGYVRDHGPLLGLGLPQPPAARVTVAEGDVLVMATDGLVERRDEDIDTSLARLAAVAAKGPRAPEDMCGHLLKELPPDGRDDIALMVVAVGPHRAG